MDEEGETVREGVAQNGTGRQTGETGGAGGDQARPAKTIPEGNQDAKFPTAFRLFSLFFT